MTPHDGCRVSPFGHPRIKACSAAPRGFSQPTTSFIGSRRQGIHRWLFVAWKNKDARARYAILKGLYRSSTSSGNDKLPARGRQRLSQMRTTRPRGRRTGHRGPGALPGNRRENERPSRRTRREIRRSTTVGVSKRPSNQCINWVVARWPGRMAEQSARRTP